MIEIGFEWPVAKAYHILPADPAPPSERILSTRRRGPFIAPKSKSVERKRPLEIRPTLYLDFADLDKTPEACLAFASLWGLLGLPLYRDSPEKGEPVSGWIQAIERMREGVEAHSKKTLAPARSLPPIANLRVRLVEGPRWNVPYRLQLVPPSLLDAMWLQFAQAVAHNQTIKSCEQCGTWFETGVNADRRRGSRFCTDKCRIDYNNAHRHRKAQS